MLAYLAFDCLRRRFIWLQTAARESPRRERSVRVPEQKNPPLLVEHDAEDADEKRLAREYTKSRLIPEGRRRANA